MPSADSDASPVTPGELHEQVILISSGDKTDELLDVIQALSLAREIETVMAITRRAARRLTGAHGATFVLREGDLCHYADEDAIAPLWKGRRFPMTACISGWSMLHCETVAIPDVFADPRIPHDLYKNTFIKSMVMTPIRSQAPIGAIGAYWSKPHQPRAEEIRLLQSLANSTSIALENVALINQLETRVRERTDQLEHANRELEAFSYSVSHDLRAPLRAINGFSQALLEDCQSLDANGRRNLNHILSATRKMDTLIQALLDLSRFNRMELRRVPVDISGLATALIEDLRLQDRERQTEVIVHPSLTAHADLQLARVVLTNLLANAWKFTRHRDKARIEIGECVHDGQPALRIKDNGVGFDMQYADKLFTAFQRLHPVSEFEGTGIGLATVARVINRHGGRIWAEGAVDQGAAFYFTFEEQDRMEKTNQASRAILNN